MRQKLAVASLLWISGCAAEIVGEVTQDWVDGVPPGSARIFVTQGTTGASLADKLSWMRNQCALEASQNSLKRTYVPLISYGAQDAINLIGLDTPVYKVNSLGTVIAVSSRWQSMFQGLTTTILSEVNVDATGAEVSAPFVFTGTNSNGRVDSDHCSNWSSTAGNGRYGIFVSPNGTSDRWISNGPYMCTQNGRVYCISTD